MPPAAHVEAIFAPWGVLTNGKFDTPARVAICECRRKVGKRSRRIRVMRTKLLGCLAATAMAADIVVATPAMALLISRWWHRLYHSATYD
jgi:hypothetical protein